MKKIYEKYGLSRLNFKEIEGRLNTKYFVDKVVIVTGASSGIGKACAMEFARYGARVVLAARREDKLEETCRQIHDLGGECIYKLTDVKKIDDCKALIDYTIEKFDRIDILINNAGISMRASFEDLDLDVIRQLMDTNFFGSVYCTKFALPYLLKQRGTVIGISSISAITALPGRTGYTASKYAMDGFFSSLRMENFRKGLNVLLVHPGFTSSEIRTKALNSAGKPQEETPRNEKRMMSSEKVAAHIVQATRKRNRDLILTPQGKIAVWLHRTFPGISDRIILNEMSREKDSPV